jgi:hypothetical protein
MAVRYETEYILRAVAAADKPIIGLTGDKVA